MDHVVPRTTSTVPFPHTKVLPPSRLPPLGTMSSKKCPIQKAYSKYLFNKVIKEPYLLCQISQSHFDIVFSLICVTIFHQFQLTQIHTND